MTSLPRQVDDGLPFAFRLHHNDARNAQPAIGEALRACQSASASRPDWHKRWPYLHDLNRKAQQRVHPKK